MTTEMESIEVKDVLGAEAMDDFTNMAEIVYSSFDNLKEGEVINGVIVKIDKNDVLVDIGYKSEGIIPKHEFRDATEIEMGKEIEVYLESLEDSDGNVVISKIKAEKVKSWDKTIRAFEEGGEVEGKVVRKVKGGLIVDVGMDAFLPASQIDIKPIGDIDSFLYKTFKFKIVKINLQRKNIVISRREFIEAERSKGRDQILGEIQKGDIRKGIVKNITDFGVFIDLGGLDGLLHITDMSWGRVNHPTEVVKLGEEVEVMILDIDKDKNRVSLGMKQKSENPWIKITEKYPVEEKVSGVVVNITNYGAFVELEKGVEGLIHISEMSWTKRVNHPSEIVNIGDPVEAVVLNINADEQKISLGLKQIGINPWSLVNEKYTVGQKVKGILRNITDYGSFVELEEGIDGLIHISDMSWTKRVNHPSEMLKKGQEVETVVLSVDADNKKISLGLKQMMSDPWETIAQQYPLGLEVKGKVVKITKFGLFVLLSDDIEGLIHNTQLELPQDSSLEDAYNVGDEITSYIFKVDIEQRKIGLTMKQDSSEEEKNDVEATEETEESTEES